MAGEEIKKEEKINNKENNKIIENIVENIEKLSLVEANDLAKRLSEKFGVSLDQIQVGGNNSSNSQNEKNEPKNVSVVISEYGAEYKLPLIKFYREINKPVSLADALKIVTVLPFEVKKDIPAAEAEEIKKQIIAISEKIKVEIK